MPEERLGLVHASDRVPLRHCATSESSELREDVPHPVRAFPTASELAERASVVRCLSPNKAFQIVGICVRRRLVVRFGAHSARPNGSRSSCTRERSNTPTCGQLQALVRRRAQTDRRDVSTQLSPLAARICGTGVRPEDPRQLRRESASSGVKDDATKVGTQLKLVRRYRGKVLRNRPSIEQ